MTFPPHWTGLAWVLACTTLAAGCARNAVDPGWDVDLDADLAAPPDAGSDTGAPDAAPPPAPGLDASQLADSGGDAGAPDGGGDEQDAGRDAAPADAGRDDAGDAGGGDAGTSECVPGVYRGAFSGEVRLLAVIAINISGEISINVDTDSSGELMVIKNGRVDGEDQDGNPVTAVVNGTMNCKTKKLQAGTLTDGEYKRPVLPVVNFTGTVTADYSPSPPSATGRWATSDGFLEMGGGTWSAALVP